MGFDGLFPLVQIDPQGPAGQTATPAAELHLLATQHSRIECAGFIDRIDRQHQVIQARDDRGRHIAIFALPAPPQLRADQPFAHFCFAFLCGDARAAISQMAGHLIQLHARDGW